MSISAAAGPVVSALSGKISNAANKLFNAVDTSGNGTLSLDEFLVAGEKVPVGNSNPAKTSIEKALFSAIDTDNDRAVSKDELKAFGKKAAENLQAKLLELRETYGNAATAANVQQALAAYTAAAKTTETA